MLNGVPSQIAIRLPDDQLAAIDAAVRDGRFESRAAAVRAAIDRLLDDERNRKIAEQYRRGYGEQPQEDWVGEMGLAVGSELVRRERKAARRRR
jgi:Arc/MetJ-type ribon-helix-helix transcriptional regulator